MSAQPRLTIVPLAFRQGRAFVALHHRHHPKTGHTSARSADGPDYVHAGRCPA